MRRRYRGRRHGWGKRTAIALLCSGSLSGCGPSAKLTVWQPGLPPPLNEMHLESRWAHFDDGSQDRYLAAFPFPGAQAGDRQFLLYLVCEPGMGDKLFSPRGSAGGGYWGVGFFVQESGERAGLARVADGVASVHAVPFGGKKRRRVRLTVHCEDGTSMSGTLTAVRSPLNLRDFEEGPHAADVAALLADTFIPDAGNADTSLGRDEGR